jgi:hypothetical protein
LISSETDTIKRTYCNHDSLVSQYIF